MSVRAEEPIAIVGLACRFPGADDSEAFWCLLRDGIDAIGDVPADRWDVDALYDPDLLRPGSMSSRWGGFISGVGDLDAGFFGLSPLEAAAMDPQQRLALEMSWTALEHSGVVPARLAGTRAGVFMGVAYNDYASRTFANPENYSAYSPSGIELSMVPNRISQFYDLRGPSLAVNTGCSSSLVAVHLACQSLRVGESDRALAGGVSLVLAPEPTIALSQAWMLAADGRCKAFDARADGYVRGEGCGIVVLKRLADARREGDRILSVILGSAVNHGGKGSGLTAPNGAAQRAVLQEALAAARTRACDVSYVEAHGVGTKLGDATEMAALQAVLVGGGRTCAIGSVKTNIGHLEWASGIASLIKTVLALQRETIPPHLHLTTLNPEILLEGTRFVVPTAPLPWPRGAVARVAGVNSFGLGGTNAHLVVSDDLDPPQEEAAISARPLLLALSARSPAALARAASNHAAALAESNDALALCATTNARRTHFTERAAFWARDATSLSEGLVAFTTGNATSNVERSEIVGPPRVAFLFTGQGAQYVGMGRTLAREEPAFRDALRRCAERLDPVLGRSLMGLLYDSNESSEIHQTQFSQPVLFAIEYALAELWRSWGIVPEAMLGHSVGEYVAACVGGALTLEDAATLIAERGRLMGSLPRDGAMVSVVEDESAVRARLSRLGGRVDVAAVNGPRNIVVSGPTDAIDELVASLDDDFVATQRLTVSHAFHSQLMDPVLDAFAASVARVRFAPLAIPIASNTTGQLLDVGHVYSASYWCSHLRGAVRFCDGVRALAGAGVNTFLEVGPTDTLTKLGRRCIDGEHVRFVPSLRAHNAEWDTLAPALGALYARGAALDWKAIEGARACRVASAPTYPFERRRYWFTAATKGDSALSPISTLSSETPLVIELRKLSESARWRRFSLLLSDEVALLLAWPEGRRPDGDAGLFALGLTSLAAVELQARVQRMLGGAVAVHATTLFAHPSVNALTRFVLAALFPEEAEPAAPVAAATTARDAPIAIVGMGLRTPGGATNADELWRLLRDGVDATSEVPRARWNMDSLYAADRNTPGRMYTRRGGFLGDVSGFDAEFFGLSAREAEAIDPQQRLLLEVAFEAIDDAGYPKEQLRESATGVFVGIISNEYGSDIARPGIPENVDAYHVIGNIGSAVAGRVSYHLGLRGPSMALDTACSSSLVAVHLACQSLRAGECDRALAGGVNLILSPIGSLALCRAQALAGDGRCKTFDATADGYGRGEGCGVVVLRRLSQALADGDRVLGVIRGSAVNHDGASAGFTVPSGASQSEVVRTALLRAGVEPDQVDYVEAHGTGTPLGDPIEVAALAEVFAGRSKPLALASVKTNLGHLEAAAGVIGLIKTVLSLTHEALPPHLHLRRLNPHLSAPGMPIEIPLKLTAWARSERRRIAGVSAFGMSGTNAHVVVEEAPAPDLTGSALQRLLPFILTAGSPEGLRACATAWSEWLPSTPSALADIAHTAATRRTHHEHRLIALACRREELAVALRAFGEGRVDDPDLIHGIVSGESPTLADEANADRAYDDEATLRAVAAAAVAGSAAVPWSKLIPPGKVVSLPSYAWRRRRHWRTTEPALILPHPDGAALPPPLAEQVDEDGLMLWELDVAERLTPGTALLFLGDIGRQRLGRGAIVIRELQLRSIVDGQRLRLVGRERLGSVDVEIQTRAGVPGRWAKLASAVVRRDPDDDAAAGSGVVDVVSRRAFRDAMDGAIIALRTNAEGPLVIEQAHLHELPPACSTWIVRAADARGAQICEGDQVYAQLLGVRNDAPLRSTRGPVDISRWLYGVTWRPSALVAGNAPGCVLLIGGDDFAAQLATHLEDHGATVMFGTDPTLGVDCIVDLRAIGSLSNTAGSLVTRSLARAGDLLELAQRVTAVPGRRLYVVTRGAVVAAVADVLAPESAPLWGMGRAIQHEHPELAFTLIDIGESAATESQLLACELLAGARDTQVALRAEQRLTPELGRLTLSTSPTGTGEAALLETRRPGFVDDVRFRQTVRRPPGPTEIEVRVTHLPLSFLDVMRATAMNGEPAEPLPLGYEWGGEAVRVGAGVTRLAVGDRAVGLSPNGVGTYVTVCEDLAVAVPREIPLARAVTLPLAFALAHHALVDIARLQPGERLLVHSATGAVGQACMQYARWIGAEVLATAGDEPRRQWLQRGGVRDVFDSRTLAFVEGVRHAMRGAGVDVVVSSVAGPAVVASHGLLRPFGRFVDIGRRRMRGARPSDSAAVDNVASIRVDLIKTMAEEPARIGRLLDAVMVLVKKGALTPLDPELRKADDAARALRAMAQLSHLGKVVLTLEPSPLAEADNATARIRLRDDASYLVTGGLGGLGLQVAHWLVERGARHLVLVSRRGPDDAAMESIAALTRQGAKVTAWQADLGLHGEVERLLSQLRRGHPALAGIVHAAGILDDAILAHQSRTRLAAVFAAKAAGAWHLHDLVHESLDFFVMFSSLASAIGSPGQANYAAANSALDALAEFRLARGLPALSIQWGPWDQVGMAARGDRGRRADAIGLKPMACDAALSALERLLESSTTRALVVDARWRQLSAALPGLATAWDIAPLLEDEAPNVAGSAVHGADARTLLETAQPAERAALLVEWLRVALASVMRLPAESIDPKAPLDRLGLDSLAAVELNHRVRAGYGQALPATEILRAPSLYSVAGALLGELGLANPTRALPPLPTAPRGSPSPWFVVAEPRPHARLRLVCFPFAGGGPAVFRDWPRGLPPTIEVMAAQLPGRAARTREPALTRMGPLVEALVDALEPFLDRPFAFFGHCMGALVMFEVARRLRECGRPLPRHLFVSASPAPNGYLVPALNPETGRYLNVRPGADQALVPVHALPPADFFDVLRFLNFGQTRVLLDDPELMLALLPAIQADFEVCDRYRYCSEAPLSIPITAVGGDADPFATHTELLRWAKETGAPFELLMRSGDHYFLFPERDWLLDLIAGRA